MCFTQQPLHSSALSELPDAPLLARNDEQVADEHADCDRQRDDNHLDAERQACRKATRKPSWKAAWLAEQGSSDSAPVSMLPLIKLMMVRTPMLPGTRIIIPPVKRTRKMSERNEAFGKNVPG